MHMVAACAHVLNMCMCRVGEQCCAVSKFASHSAHTLQCNDVYASTDTYDWEQVRCVSAAACHGVANVSEMLSVSRGVPWQGFLQNTSTRFSAQGHLGFGDANLGCTLARPTPCGMPCKGPVRGGGAVTCVWNPIPSKGCAQPAASWCSSQFSLRAS